jgi:hypothetical protein
MSSKKLTFYEKAALRLQAVDLIQDISRWAQSPGSCC